MLDLCLIACSARKRPEPPEPIAAIERYDGVFFRVLRKWLRTNSSSAPDVLIISARFGLIAADTSIPTYDQRMTKQRALELAPAVRAKLRSCLQQRSYSRVFVNLGKDYQPTVEGVEELAHAIWATGSIGKRAQQMKRWLEGV